MNIDFIFDGEKLSDYGYMICSFDSVGLETSTISEINFTEIKSPLSDISHKVATGYESNLSRTIQIMKMNCDDTNNYDNDNKDISTLTKWLCRKDYKWFQWIKDGVVEEIYYEVRINLKQIKLSDSSIGFELDIISNRPYGLSEEKVIEIDNNIIGTATGDVICVDNSSDNLMIDITLFGKSVQNTYSGKNLLENTATTQTINGITFTVNSDGSVTANGTATAVAQMSLGKVTIENTDVILSDGVVRGSSAFSFVHGYKNGVATYTVASTSNGECKFTNNYDELLYGIYIKEGQTLNNVVFYPMIRLASITDDTYEPYVGGVASPNPSYPQDIVSVADDGDLVISTTNNDTLSSVATISLTDSLRGIKVTEGGNYTDETGQMWVCDTLEKYADGTGKLIKRVYHKVFDGTESFTTNANTIGGGVRLNFVDNNVKKNISNSSLTGNLCNRLIEVTPDYLWNNNINAFAIQHTNNALIFRITDITDVTTLNAQLKSWYDAGEPLEFICERANYIETPLTAEQLSEIEKLQTFNPITHVYTDDIGDVGIQYYKNPSSIAVHNVNLDSDDEGYIYPDAVITVNESGNLIITNKFENRITRINNCKAGEIITFIGGGTLQITSNNALHDLSTDFNYNFIRLCNKYGNSDNIFTANLDCDIQLNFREKRKVGI